MWRSGMCAAHDAMGMVGRALLRWRDSPVFEGRGTVKAKPHVRYCLMLSKKTMI